jgi:peptidoglycan/LPS O-acetylase OafA/YrhL
VERVGPFAQLTLALLALPPSLLVAHYSQRVIEVRVTRWLKRTVHGTRTFARPALDERSAVSARESSPVSRGLEPALGIAADSAGRSE